MVLQCKWDVMGGNESHQLEFKKKVQLMLTILSVIKLMMVKCTNAPGTFYENLDFVIIWGLWKDCNETRCWIFTQVSKKYFVQKVYVLWFSNYSWCKNQDFGENGCSSWISNWSAMLIPRQYFKIISKQGKYVRQIVHLSLEYVWSPYFLT